MKSNLPAWLVVPALFMSCLAVSCANRQSGNDADESEIEIIGAKSITVDRGKSNRRQVPDEMLATAHELVPGFEIESAERESEWGEASWSFEGMAGGREIELEFAER